MEPGCLMNEYQIGHDSIIRFNYGAPGGTQRKKLNLMSNIFDHLREDVIESKDDE